MKKLMIIGAGGHGKVAADIAKNNGYEEIVFLDDKEDLTECGEYPVAGKGEEFRNYTCDMFVAVGNPSIRKKYQEEIEGAGKNIATLVHPNAIIGDNVKIGKGTVVMAGVVINSDSVIGKSCIINTCASIDHDNVVGDYAHISVGSHLAGTVHIGNNTWVGIGAVVNNNINVCNDCMIGAGAVVIRDIDTAGTYIGVPAKKMDFRQI